MIRREFLLCMVIGMAPIPAAASLEQPTEIVLRVEGTHARP